MAFHLCAQTDVYGTEMIKLGIFRTLVSESSYWMTTILTISSLWISMYAENSSNRNLWVAIARPSHGAWAGGWPVSMSPETAVAGLPAGYGGWANGLILYNQ